MNALSSSRRTVIPPFSTNLSRRQFLGSAGINLGGPALACLLNQYLDAATTGKSPPAQRLDQLPNDAPRAKRVIYLCQTGAPSQVDLFDYKPRLKSLHGTQIPDSVRDGQRLTEFTSGQAKLPIAAPSVSFTQRGQCGRWISDLLPYTAGVVDQLCFVNSVHTEAINHDPALTMIQTGSQRPGRASLGAWVSYGLGSENHDLPTFVVMISQNSNGANAQPLYDRLWGSGFLPSKHQGVKFRSVGDPVVFLTNPPGVVARTRRRLLNDLAEINRMRLASVGDPEIAARITQYELAFRMQTSVPELMDTSGEPESIYQLYGPDSRRPGTFAANCLLARRMVERGVRVVQLYHRGWDHHSNLPASILSQCRDTDQGSAALIRDLQQRGLLEDTLVIWGGEFGRTVFSQGKLTATNYGRDHHPRCFTVWLAGAGLRPGFSYGKTDDFSYNVVENPVHVHDLNATILHCLGLDHTQLTFKFQGRRHRLTDVGGKIIRDLFA